MFTIKLVNEFLEFIGRYFEIFFFFVGIRMDLVFILSSRKSV